MDVTLPVESLKGKIYLIRGQKVLLDSDLAEMYGVDTKRLNEQVRRNISRFPADFMFQLDETEHAFLRSHFATLKSGRGGHRKYRPYVFTEQGVAMLSSVLNSERAVQVNIAIMRAFVEMREMAVSNRVVAKRLDELEQKYDSQFKIVFDAIRQLMTPSEPKRKKIGFRPGDEKWINTSFHANPRRETEPENLLLVTQSCKGIKKSNQADCGLIPIVSWYGIAFGFLFVIFWIDIRSRNMKKTGLVVTIFLLLAALFFPLKTACAATDGIYQLSEVISAWDGTDASRTKAPTADYDYTYGDEASVTYTLPWSFSFYGQSYSQITADTNGNIWFGAAGSAHSFDLATTGHGPVIAAWNNDLSSYYYGGVFIQHKTNPERVVIEWQTETYTEEGFYRPNNFAVVLFPNGSIRTDYKTFTTTNGKDFGSGISRGDGLAVLNLTTGYGNVFSLAGRSFLYASGQKIYTTSQSENFGDVITGTTSQPHAITVVNSGTDNLLITTATLTANSSGMFSLVPGGDSCPGRTLAPSQSCSVQAVFAPTDPGQRTATLSIGSNNPATPSLDITLSGAGRYPTLAVAKGDTGTGTVTSAPAAISCGTACSGQFTTGATVTLTATPDAGSAFTGWSGACAGLGDCTVTMDVVKNVTASFTPTTAPTVTIFSPTGNSVVNRPVLQYAVSTGTVGVKVDGAVVNKVSGDTLDTLADGSHLIRVEATIKAGYTGYAESTVIVDTLPPTVATVSPAAGAQNAPVNAAIVITFNEPLNAASVIAGSIVLSSSFGPVPGALTVSADKRSLTFKPAVQLGYNRTYTVLLKAGIQDVSGTATTADYSYTFTALTASTDLVGFWHMDGDWSDSSGNGSHGTAYGGTTFSTDRSDGTTAGSFDGVANRVTIPDAPLFQNMQYITAEAWIKPAIIKSPGAWTTSRQSIISFKEVDSMTAGAVLALPEDSPDKIRFWVNINNTWYAATGSTVISPNTWYHVVGTYNGSEIVVYVNGVVDGRQAVSGKMKNGASSWTIGARASNNMNWFNGLIDKVALYKRALTAQEILGHFNDIPHVAIASPGQAVKYKPGEIGTATVTVTHPVGVSSLTCTAGGSATDVLAQTIDPPRTQVQQDYTFLIAANATANAAVSITCSSIDASSNVGRASLNLAVADLNVPIVVSSSISDNATNVSATLPIVVNFSKALAPATVNASTVTLTADNGTSQASSGSAVLSTDQKSITVTPTVALDGNTSYRLTISTAVTDTVGNPLPQDYVLHFTTQPVVAINMTGQGSTSAPVIVAGGRFSTISIDNSYVIFNGPVTADSISLKNGTVLTHYGATTTTTYKLGITASSVSVDATSKIDVSGRGYLGAWQGGNSGNNGMTYGTTTIGGSTLYNGGSYGGQGGMSGAGGSVNASYGTLQSPNEVGSGGGGNGTQNPGGNGGGLVKITAGTLDLSGSILADGGGVTGANGGGSGGGILLSVGTLSGNGTISARGGANTGNNTYFPGGGGGRIAIYYNTKTLPVANIVASGGKSYNGTSAKADGGAGTIYLKDNASVKGDVIVNNGGIVTSNATTVPSGDNGPFDVKDMTVTGTLLLLNGGLTAGGNLTLDSSNVNVAGAINVTGALTLKNSTVMSHSAATTTATYKLDVTAGTIDVEATSKIDVSSKGYLGAYQGGNSTSTGRTLGNTTTGGSTIYNGGSYGGLGGISGAGGSVNTPYGNLQLPNEVGSGGGGNSVSNQGGNGGGLVTITGGALNLAGSILANGANVTGASGGGSGGGILINVGVLSGNGTIYARGGANTGNNTWFPAGGGGRIAIYYNTNTLPVANFSAAGGQSANGTNPASNGGAGTVYLFQNVMPLTVTKAGTGTGTVQSTPAGISCGATCSGNFAKTSSVILSATPDISSTFSGWSGACGGSGPCTVTMDAAKAVTALFTSNDITPPTVSSVPAGGIYNAARNVTLSANEPATIYYTTDNTTLTTSSSVYSTPLVIGATTTLKFFAKDLAGNSSGVQTQTYVIDTVPPVIQVSTLANGSYTNNSVLNITGTASDTTAGIKELKINGVIVPVNAAGSYSYALVLANGANLITIVAADQVDNQASDSRTITLDQTAPNLLITGPADNSKTATDPLTVSGTVDETSAVTVKMGNNLQTAAMNGANFSADVTLVPGTNTIDVIATDLAGNTNTRKRTVVYDDQTPSLAITDPSQDIRTNAANLTIRGMTADPYTSVTVSVTIDGQTFDPPVVNGAFEQAVIFTSEKSYAIVVTATNEVGTMATVQRNVIYDITPSVLTIDPVTSPTNQNNQVVTGTMEAGATVTVTCTTAAVGVVTYPTATTWSAQVSGWTAATNIIAITAADAAGNTINATTQIVYDTTPPTGTIAINNGAAVTNATQVQLALSASDANGVSQMRISSDGANWTDAEAFASTRAWLLVSGDGVKQVLVQYKDNAGNWSANPITAAITLDTTPPGVSAAPAGGIFKAAHHVALTSSEPSTIYYTTDGTIPTTVSTVYSHEIAIQASATLKYIARDPAGNISDVKSESYVIDTVPPLLGISTLSDGTYTNNQTLNVTGYIHDDMGVKDLQINGVIVPVNSDESFSSALLLQSGANTVTTIATDMAGNKTTDTRMITLDQATPALVITSPADNSKTGTALIDVTGTVGETSTVTVKLGNTIQSVSMNGNDFTANVVLAPRDNTIEVTALDLANNTSTLKRTVFYDDRIPFLAVTDPSQDIRTRQGSLVIRGAASDPYGLAVTVRIDLDGQIFTPQVVNGTFEESVTLTSEKTYSIVVTAANEDGTATSVQRNIIYDVTPPGLTINPVASPTSQTGQTISGTMEVGTTVAVTCATATTGVLSYPTATTWTVGVTNLHVGNNVITVTATDSAGNAATVSATIMVSNNNSVSDTSPAKLWIGLQNSDDQGTQFDLRAELYINGVRISEGATLCIAGVTRNPALAKEIAVPFILVSNGSYASGDLCSLKVFTRIGTTATGQKCTGPGGSHNNAVGLRLYYDAPDRPSRFSAAIAPDPLKDYYLHATNGSLVLDAVTPSGAQKYKDSSSINFTNGNPWKEIGTWTKVLQ
jgi:hypothetical protein